MGDAAERRAGTRPDIAPTGPLAPVDLQGSTPPRRGGVHAKVAWVTGQIGTVGRDGWHDHNKFRYASAGALVAAVQPLLVRAGLVVVPSVVRVRGRDSDPAKPGRGSRRVVMEYRLVDVDDPAQLVVARVPGEAEDLKGDKALAKAITAALAAFLKQTFLLVVGDADDRRPAGGHGERRSARARTPQHQDDLSTIRGLAPQLPAGTAALVDGAHVDDVRAYAQEQWDRARANAGFARALAEALEGLRHVWQAAVPAAAPAAPARSATHAAALDALKAGHRGLPDGERALVGEQAVQDLRGWLREHSRELGADEALALDAAAALRRALRAVELRAGVPQDDVVRSAAKMDGARNRKLWATAGTAGYTDAALHAMLLERFGLESVRDVTLNLYAELLRYAGDKELATLYAGGGAAPAAAGAGPAGRR